MSQGRCFWEQAQSTLKAQKCLVFQSNFQQGKLGFYKKQWDWGVEERHTLKTFLGILTSPQKHFPERTLSRMYIWPNGHFPEKLFSRMDTCQNVHLAEWTFPRKAIFQNGHLRESTFRRMDISPKSYFPEWTLARMYIWPNGHFPEKLFSRMDTCQNVHLAEWTFSLKAIFQNKIRLPRKSFLKKYVLRKIIQMLIFCKFSVTSIIF